LNLNQNRKRTGLEESGERQPVESRPGIKGEGAKVIAKGKHISDKVLLTNYDKIAGEKDIGR
jgi:hypothetical protein